MNNIATTVAGVVTIAGSLMTFVGVWLSVGVPPSEAWTACGAGIAMGVGLIKAADAKNLPPPPPPSVPGV